MSAVFDYHVDGQIASATHGDKSENFLWDGLALIHRGETSFVNEPYVTGGNPILSSKDGVMFNDMLGNTLGTKSADAFNPISMTAFGETSDKSAMFTGKPYIGELGYAFLFRNYRADQGKWQTSDPFGYPDGWNNLAYVKNKVICYIDRYGLAAGDICASPDVAAIAWGYEFNRKSIDEKVEYASTIYRKGTGYSYTDPQKGTHNGSYPTLPIPDDPDETTTSLVVAEIHSHGEYDPALGNGSDVFSTIDKDGYDAWEHCGYVVTPNGSLQKYDPQIEDKNKRITLISDKMPYDPKHPKPLNPVKE